MEWAVNRAESCRTAASEPEFLQSSTIHIDTHTRVYTNHRGWGVLILKPPLLNHLKCNLQQGNGTLLLVLDFSGCGEGSVTRGCELFLALRRPAPHHLRKGTLVLSPLSRAPLCHHTPWWTSPFTDYASEYNFKAICREQQHIWDGIRISWFVLLQQPTSALRDTEQAISLIPRSRSLLHGTSKRRERKTSIQLTEQLATTFVLTFRKGIMQVELFFSSALKHTL